MWNPNLFMSDLGLISALAIAGLSWLGAGVLLVYFAWQKRSPRQKHLSLIVPIVISISSAIGIVIIITTHLSWMQVALLPLIAFAFSGLGFFVTFLIANFLTIVFPNEKIAYGLSAVLLFGSPVTSGLNAVLAERRNDIVVSRIRHAAEPSIALCCEGNVMGCRETAIAFGKVFDFKVRSHETTMRNKYWGQACRLGNATDCEMFAASIGAEGESFRNDPLYREACDVRDLYSDPPPREWAEEY